MVFIRSRTPYSIHTEQGTLTPSRAFWVGHPSIWSRAFGVGHPAIQSRAFRVGQSARQTRTFRVGHPSIRIRAFGVGPTVYIYVNMLS